MREKIRKAFLNDKFILLLILCNSFTIFVQGFEGKASDYMALFNYIDVVFTLLFLVELIVKVRQWGWKKYLSSNWNRLDFILVVLSIPSVFIIFMHAHLANLSFILVLRMSRVFKFFRFIKFIPGIEQIIKGVQRAIKDSILVLLGFIVYNFVVSVFSCYLFKDLSPELFGDPLKAFYSTFRVFTVEGWYEIPHQVLQGDHSGIVHFFTKFYFIFILITGGIFGLSLVNSIFVDAMVSDNNDDVEKKLDRLNQKLDDFIASQKKQESS